jgi:thiamine-phosphate pyrophosphorylase
MLVGRIQKPQTHKTIENSVRNLHYGGRASDVPALPSNRHMDPVLRILDANANRTREGLRVLEDYCRFVLNHEGFSAALKSIRHRMTDALRSVEPAAILRRDTPGDVGTAVSLPTETHRQDLADVVTAAGKRTGEAIRCLEEFLKITDPSAAAIMESCRYELYELERRIALTLRPPNARLSSALLHVLITESCCRKGDWRGAAQAALRGGADVLQLREKSLDGRELLERAKFLVAACHEAGALCIINDRVDIAQLSGADGVHLGQTDLPAAEARKLLGPRALIGVSTHESAHAHQARLDGADYIGAGPVFPSATKPRDISPGLPYLRSLADFSLPVFAIAGITLERVPQVVAAGTSRIAVTAAATDTDDVEAACRNLRSALAKPTEPSPGSVM